MTDLPEGLSADRHLALSGRGHHPWIRRSALSLFAVVVVAALFDVFGERPSTSTAEAPAGVLEVQAPAQLRGGLIFQARFTITAREPIAKPTLILDRGWFESMSVNSIIPDPQDQSSVDGRVRLALGPLAAGSSTTMWIYFQVNPTNVGRRAEAVELADGDRSLVHISRSITVFP